MPKRKSSPMPEHSPAAKTDPETVGRLKEWLVAHGADLDGMDMRCNPDGSFGVYATRAFKAGSSIGNLPAELILDPIKVLATDPVAIKARAAGGSSAFSFWLSLASNRSNATHAFAPYLAALPREAPDPCAWPTAARALLTGTQLGTQVERQRQLLADEYKRIAPAAAPHLTLDDVLWARGVHLSRGFPRALVEAAHFTKPHEVLASDTIDASLVVEHGGGGAARVTWTGGAQEKAASDGRSDTGPCPSEASEVSRKAPKAGGLKTAATAEASPAEASATTEGTATHAETRGEAEEEEEEEEEAAGNLGCMLPMYDMLDHKGGHPIGWEAGCGGVRFRCRVEPCVLPGAPLYNNYGPKGNGELLFTCTNASDSNTLPTGAS